MTRTRPGAGMKRAVPRLDGPARDVARGELAGRECRIAAASDAGLVGREGIVVDETLRTLHLRTPTSTITVSKPGTTFAFRVAGREVLVDGRAIEYRPADRTKKVR